VRSSELFVGEVIALLSVNDPLLAFDWRRAAVEDDGFIAD
jgi:hypothetical protein